MNILLTGATGYIGRRLKERLLDEEEVRLRLFVRNTKKIGNDLGDRVEIFQGNTLDRESLHEALSGIDIAYYLVHSMGAKTDFEQLDRMSAQNFLEACLENRVKRIIYLGGLGKKETASKHLRSRLETGEILSSRPDRIQTIWFRAGVIIGAGSASFEIIRHLVQKIPLMITPKWVHTKTQPIGIEDVLEYLCQAKTLGSEKSLIIDIGAEQMSFKEMLLRAAHVMGLKRRLIALPVLTPWLSSYWLMLITPVPFSVARALIHGLKSETIVQNENAKKYFPFINPQPYQEAFAKAIEEIVQMQVISHWTDSISMEVSEMIGQNHIESAIFTSTQVHDFGSIPGEKIFTAIESIGGDNGWLKYDWLWRIRGFLDQVFAGPGLNRGRRDPRKLRVGDSLDFWKVIDLKPGRRLLLVNQMKLPGRAWLGFKVEGTKLAKTAYFYPKGLWGRLYWYLMAPLHKLVFSGIVKEMIKKADKL